MTYETNGFSACLIRLFEDLRDSLTFEQAQRAILEHLKDIVPHQSVAVVMVDENTNELLIRNARQISYLFIKDFLRPIRGSLLLRRVLLKHETIVLSNASPSDPGYAEVRLEHDFQSLCLAPVLHQQRAIGYLHCDRASAVEFSAEEIRRLQTIGILIGLFVEKFSLLALTRHLDRIDGPSKALKYHAFLEEYYREHARARIYHQPLSLLFLDIDNYTRFVATCGIGAGHNLLNEVRQLIEEKIRPMDVVGRFSADQFIVCLGGMNNSEASAVLEAIRKSVQDSAGQATGSKITLTGVVMTFERPEDFETSLAKALAALGSGLITAHAHGNNQSMAINPPRA